MNVTSVLQAERKKLVFQIAALDRAIHALNGARPARGTMSAAQRAEASRKMKAIWAARRKQTKASK